MRAPDVSGMGSAVRAWEIEPTGSVCGRWLVSHPGAHPSWSWWVVSAVHLREEPGLCAPSLQFDEATHEIISVALDPGYEPDPDNLNIRYLTPIDLVHQVGGITDAQAAHLVRGMVLWSATGEISLDSDYASVWKRTLNRTVEHIVLGVHTQGSA